MICRPVLLSRDIVSVLTVVKRALMGAMTKLARLEVAVAMKEAVLIFGNPIEVRSATTFRSWVGLVGTATVASKRAAELKPGVTQGPLSIYSVSCLWTLWSRTRSHVDRDNIKAAFHATGQ
jgi:hypothetical protein